MVGVRRITHFHVVHLASEPLIRIDVLNHAFPLSLRSAAKGDSEGQLGVAPDGVVVGRIELPDLVDLGRHLE